MIPGSLLDQIQRRTEDFYLDKANYIIRSIASKDPAGQPVYSETAVVIPCSFSDAATPELWGEIEIQHLDGEIRFSSLTPTKGGLIEITEHLGLLYTQQRYEIVSILDRGPFGCICALKAVKV
jgi:hypothetical protein